MTTFLPSRRSTIVEFTENGFYNFMNGEKDTIEGVKTVDHEYTKYGTILTKIVFVKEESKIKYLTSK